jgi:putative CocE/NonD family hydrolase
MRLPSSLLATIAVLALAAAPRRAPAQATSSESVDTAFDRREEMIPMRDGVRLFTVILTPKHASGVLPILMMRTPYGAANWGKGRGFAIGTEELRKDGYIFVEQDIRGRHGSEGEFLMNHPPRDKADPRSHDESSDTYDTIDWLVKNVAGNSGRVGVFGISYPGWLAAVAGIDPHPALKAISPQAPMGDTWMGDDFFHQGAFRQTYGLEYAWQLEASKDESVTPSPGRYDTYDWYRSFPSLDSLARAVGANAWPTWRRFVAHPTYDSVWRERALRFSMPRTVVPTLTVGGWWDQEDAYGPQAAYLNWERHDSAGINYLVEGPWYHGQWFADSGVALGNAQFGSPTGIEYRQLQAKWFAYWLHGNGDGKFAEATVYDAGANRWRTFDRWPAVTAPKNLYFEPNGKLGFDAPRAAGAAADAFVSDPAHPVPYRSRPVERTYAPGSRWRRWMTEDQRFVDGRPDVLTWQTDTLNQDITIAGDVVARLFASTTGADADWVVKLIDVYPDTVAERPAMGGYELMVAGDIMRGRYRTSFEHPIPAKPGAVQAYAVDLHQQAYTFRRGHRIMVQVQSTWFPLYDRNPQTWVPNIFKAKPSDFRAETHRVFRTARYPSHVELPVLAP